jgi:tetratricopeptide (TPR) repeat protein
LIKIYEQTKAVKTLDSLASLSFIYKDWETSMDYAKKAIEVNPTAERYFILGGASGFRALEVPILSSLKYVNIMKPAFEQAVRLEPMNVKYLRAQVDVLLSLPIILGGSINKAKQHIKKIKFLNPVEGFLAEGSMHEINEDFDSAKQVYKQLFDFINQNYSFCSLTFIKDDRRDLAYDLGRIAADFELNENWGLCALSHFAETYGQKDTVPISWVYFQSARLAKRLKNMGKMNFFISKTKLYLNQSSDEKLRNLLKSLEL